MLKCEFHSRSPNHGSTTRTVFHPLERVYHLARQHAQQARQLEQQFLPQERHTGRKWLGVNVRCGYNDGRGCSRMTPPYQSENPTCQPRLNDAQGTTQADRFRHSPVLYFMTVEPEERQRHTRKGGKTRVFRILKNPRPLQFTGAVNPRMI